MGRIATIFVAICMGIIAVSAAAVLMFQFGRPFGEAISLSLALMCTMAVFHLLISRARDRGDVREAVDRLEDRMADLDDDVGNLEGRLTGVEHAVPRRARDEMDPLFSEVEVLGSLVRQMAEAMSDLEARVEDQQMLPMAPAPAELPHYSAQVPPPAAGGYDNRQSYQEPQGQSQRVAPPRDYDERQDPSHYRGDPAPAQGREAGQRHDPFGESRGQTPGDDERSNPVSEDRSVEQKSADQMRSAAQPQTKAEAPVGDPMMREMILSALNANRVELHLQPIVTLPQRQVKYYEALTRLRDVDGNLIEAGDFLPEAIRSGLIARIDSLQLFRSVQVTKRLSSRNRKTVLFCNLSSLSLVDDTFFPGFLEFVNANRQFSESLIFEFSQDDVAQMGVLELESLSALFELGFSFSIDRITTLRMDFKALAQKGFRYAKLQAGILVGEVKGADHGHIHPTDFGDLLARFGMELIADHVETESQVLDLLDYDVALAQGFLFSPPRPVRAEILQGTPAPVAKRRAQAGS